MTKEQIVSIIRDELEQMNREHGGNLISRKSGHDATSANVRPKHDDDVSDTIEQKGGTSKPRKTRAEKAKSKQAYDDRVKRDRFRNKVLGGEVTMQTVGIREDDIEEKKAVRGYKNKPGKNKKQCGPGNVYHGAERGRFVSPDEQKGSWALKAKGKDCSRGQYRRKGANKATNFVKRPCGRKGREAGTNIKCSTGKVHESWQSFVNEAVQEDETYRLQGGKTITGDNLRAAVKREMQQLLKSYETWVGDVQHKAQQNSKGLDDAKLRTYCDAFGFTSFRDYLANTNALGAIADNIVGMNGNSRAQQPSQQPVVSDDASSQ